MASVPNYRPDTANNTPKCPADTATQNFPGHRSSLPTRLYLLSFSPAFPPIRRAPHQPRLLILHPYTLYAIGAIAAFIAGSQRSLNSLLFGLYWLDGINKDGVDRSRIEEVGRVTGLVFIPIAAVTLALRFAMSLPFTIAAETLCRNLKLQYLEAVFAQDAAYFDVHGSGEIAAKATHDVAVIQKGLGEKVGFLIWNLGTGITCIIIAYVMSPRLAAVLTASLTLVIAILVFTTLKLNKYSGSIIATESRTSTFIEQIFAGVKVVFTFQMEPHLVHHLDNTFLAKLEVFGNKRAVVQSFEIAATHFMIFAILALGLWYGKTVVGEGLNVGAVLISIVNFFNLLSSLAGGIPAISAIRNAIHRLASVRQAIERRPFVDIRRAEGCEAVKSGKADIEIRNVTFAYPSRPTIKALDGLSMTIEAGTSVAIVGESGCGKTTVASLITRDYDPETGNVPNPADESQFYKRDALGPKRQYSGLEDAHEKAWQEKPKGEIPAHVRGAGQILLGGHDIREHDLSVVKRVISVVHQEPQLLDASVLDNVGIGLAGTDDGYWPCDIANSDSDRYARVLALCTTALKTAEIWDEVQALPNGIHSIISGGRNSSLSGGQQQRIALARALVRNAPILVLDEATSAVSSNTEARILDKLAKLQAERGTTIIGICHRLHFAEMADKVFMLHQGRVESEGHYDALAVDKDGCERFRALLHAQSGCGTATSALGLDRGHKSPTASCSTVNGPNTRASETLPVERGDPAAMQSPPRLVSRFRDLVSRREGWRMLALPVGFLIATGITATDCIHAILVGYGISSLTEVADQGAALNRYALLSLLSGVLAFVLRIISTNCLEISKERIQRRLNGEIMSAVLSRNAAFFDTPEGDAGALSAAMANHIEKTSASIGTILSQASYTVALNIAGIAVIMAFSWKIGLVAVASIILTAMSVVLHVLAQRRYERPKGDKNVNPAINQLSDAARVISSLGIYKQAAKHVEMQMDGTSERYRGMAIVSAVGSVPWALIFLEFGMIMWWSAHLYARGEATIRKAIITLIMFSSVTAQTATSTHLTTELAQGLASWRYIKESYLDKRVVSSPPREGNADLHDIRPGSVIREWCGAEINLRSVSMAYPGAVTNALNDLTLNIPAGQRTAITGVSGSGKSTLFAVLQRFYPCQSGSIQFDGQDYLSIPINHLRKRIAVVSQAAVLFEGDIRFNLCLGAPEPESVTQAELEWACKQACILDFVKGLPEGFDTDIGLKGTRLSGGQKQRLCIARALISKADILLLDEATSALDATIEGADEEALRNASRGRTTLVIAHKLQSLLSADHIVVMSHGCVVEQGTHNKLIAVEGEYKRLVETQMS